MEFTDRELVLLSEGILCLMQDAWKAQGLVKDDIAREAIEDYINELQRLNSKICNYMEG